MLLNGSQNLIEEKNIEKRFSSITYSGILNVWQSNNGWMLSTNQQHLESTNQHKAQKLTLFKTICLPMS